MVEMDQLKFASLILDKPLVDHKTVLSIPGGSYLRDVLSGIRINSGFAFVVLINGIVSDSDCYVQHGDVIHCLPQIIGGMQ